MACFSSVLYFLRLVIDSGDSHKLRADDNKMPTTRCHNGNTLNGSLGETELTPEIPAYCEEK